MTQHSGFAARAIGTSSHIGTSSRGATVSLTSRRGDVGPRPYGGAMAAPRDGLAFCVFPTAIGHCALVWRSPAHVVGSTLPHGSADGTRDAVRRWYPAARESSPEGVVVDAVSAVTALLGSG